MAIAPPDLNALARAFTDLDALSFDYDPESDTFAVYIGQPRPSVSYDMDGIRSVLYVPGTGEIVGVEVEGWEKRVIAQQPETWVAWKQMRKILLASKRQHRRSSLSAPLAALLRQVLLGGPPYAANSA